MQSNGDIQISPVLHECSQDGMVRDLVFLAWASAGKRVAEALDLPKRKALGRWSTGSGVSKSCSLGFLDFGDQRLAALSVLGYRISRLAALGFQTPDTVLTSTRRCRQNSSSTLSLASAFFCALEYCLLPGSIGIYINVLPHFDSCLSLHQAVSKPACTRTSSRVSDLYLKSPL